MTWIIVIAAAQVLLHQAGGFRVGHRCRRPPQRAAPPAFTSAARPFVYPMHSPGRPGQAVPLLNVLPRVFLAVRAAGHKTGLAPAGSAAASRGSHLLPDRKAVRLLRDS